MERGGSLPLVDRFEIIVLSLLGYTQKGVAEMTGWNIKTVSGVLNSEDSQRLSQRISDKVADEIAEHMTRFAVDRLKDGDSEFRHID